MSLGLLLAAMLGVSPQPWCHPISGHRYTWLGPPGGGDFQLEGSLVDRTVPVSKAGAPIGVKMFSQELLTGCGVQPGDVLTEINGRSVVGVNWLEEVRYQLMNERRAELALLRQGRRLRVAIEAPPLCSRASEGHYTVDASAFAVAIGFRVWFTDRSLYRGCGLEQDDVVLSVNGSPTTRPEAGFEVYASVRRTGRAEFLLLRKGKKRALIIEAR